jgi:hypothetical protein
MLLISVVSLVAGISVVSHTSHVASFVEGTAFVFFSSQIHLIFSMKFITSNNTTGTRMFETV